MKFLLIVFFIALLAFVGGIYFPWWTIAVAAFLVNALWRQRPFYAFIAGFLAVFLLWGILAYVISVRNEHLLAHKISLLIIKADQPLMLVLLTALIGGVVAGFAALTGSLLWKGKKEYKQAIRQHYATDLS